MPLPGFTEGDTLLLAAAYYYTKTKDNSNVDWDKVKDALKSASVGSVKKRMENALKKTLDLEAAGDEGTPVKAKAKAKGSPAKRGTAKKVKTPSKRKKVDSEENDEEVVKEEDAEDE